MQTTDLIFIPGGAVPSRELLATWGLFQWAAYAVEVVGPADVPGWACSRMPLSYSASEWAWREDPRGFHVGIQK